MGKEGNFTPLRTFLVCYEPTHTHSFNVSVNSSAYNKASRCGCKLTAAAPAPRSERPNSFQTAPQCGPWRKPDLNLPFLPHFLNLLIQRGSRSLGRKIKARRWEETGTAGGDPLPAAGLTLPRSWRSAAAQAPSPPASTSPNTKAELKSPPAAPRRPEPGAGRTSCNDTRERPSRTEPASHHPTQSEPARPHLFILRISRLGLLGPRVPLRDGAHQPQAAQHVHPSQGSRSTAWPRSSACALGRHGAQGAAAPPRERETESGGAGRVGAVVPTARICYLQFVGSAERSGIFQWLSLNPPNRWIFPFGGQIDLEKWHWCPIVILIYGSILCTITFVEDWNSMLCARMLCSFSEWCCAGMQAFLADRSSSTARMGLGM